LRAVLRTIEANVWKLNLDRFFASFWLIAPVLVPYYQANGLGATEIFAIQSVYSLAVLLLDVPTGYLSDIMGRRATMLLCGFLLPFGLAVYALSTGFWGFVAAEIIIAVANSLRSGTDSAMLYDTLAEIKREGAFKRLEGTGYFLELLGSSVAAVLGGVTALVSMRTPFFLNILTCLTLFPIAFALREPKREVAAPTHALSHLTTLIDTVRFALTHRVIRNAVLLMAVVRGTGIVAFFSYYLCFAKMGLSVGTFGLLTALSTLIQGAGSKASAAIEAKIGTRLTLALPLLIVPGFLLIGTFQNLYVLPLIFINAFCWGTSTPLLRDIMHKRTSSARRATVLSVSSMGARLVCVLLGVPFGKLTDLYSLGAAYDLLAGVLLLGGGFAFVALAREDLVIPKRSNTL